MEQTSLGGHCLSGRQIQAGHGYNMPGDGKDQGGEAHFLEENPDSGIWG